MIRLMLNTSVLVIVAHPDDETLWAGGTILKHPECKWFILSLCRANDGDRAPKFKNVLSVYNAQGTMGDLDDGPEQNPLEKKHIKNTILSLVPKQQWDIVVTHDPSGEYTHHIRHEEIGENTIELWHEGKIHTRQLWTFAYNDNGKRCLPHADPDAAIICEIAEDIWIKKYSIIMNIYGFSKESFEARTTPRTEAFHCFNTPDDALHYLHEGQ